MENPVTEVEGVVKAVVGLSNNSADEQRVAIEQYYTRDASFNHPLCSVAAAPFSREGLLRVYQWYRILSPKLSLEVNETTWVEHSPGTTTKSAGELHATVAPPMVTRGTLFLEITQSFRLFFSPFTARPARLVVKLSLVKEGHLWFIERQEDFYQPEDVLSMLIPPLATPTVWMKSFAGVASSVNARVFQSLGFWRTDADDDSDDESGSRKRQQAEEVVGNGRN